MIPGTISREGCESRSAKRRTGSRWAGSSRETRRRTGFTVPSSRPSRSRCSTPCTRCSGDWRDPERPGASVDGLVSFLDLGLLQVLAHELAERGQRLVHLGADFARHAALLGEGERAEALVARHALREELDALGEHVQELDDLLAGHFSLQDALLDHAHDLQERLVQLPQPLVQLLAFTHRDRLLESQQGMEIRLQLALVRLAYVAAHHLPGPIQDDG